MADGDMNLATLWLPVAPETSKIGPAMEEAGKQAKGKFGQAVKGIGDTIHDDLSKVGTKAKDTFTNLGKSFTTALSKAGTDGGKSLTDSLNQATKNIQSEPIRQFVKTANDASTSVKNLGSAFVDLKSGNVSGALDKANNSLKNIEDSAKKAGFDLEHLGVPAAATDGLAKLNSTTNDLGKHLEEARGGIERLGKSGGGLSGLVSKLGEVGVIAASIKEALNGIKDADNWLENKMPWYKGLDEQFKNNPMNSWFKGIFGDKTKPTGTTDADGNPLFASGPTSGPGSPPSPSARLPYPTTKPPVGPHNFYKDWYGPQAATPDESESAPSSRGGGGGASGRPSGSSGIGSPSSRADLHASGSRVAYLYALARSLEGTPYSQQLRNDCSGMVAQLSSAALGMAPPSAGNRFSTTNEGDWLLSHGFQEGMGGPGDFRVGWYDHGGGNAGHTAATLPGGEHAESGGSHGSFLVGPGAAGADNPEFEHHAFLHMAGGSGGMGADSGPLGSKEDPLYTAQADTGGSGGGSSPFESQGQQLGQGLVNGVLQMFGLDGSVFGGKSPLDFGAVKLGGGLLNWGMGVAKQRESYAATTGGGGGGGGGLGGVLGMIPSPGAAISAAAMPAGGSRGIGAAIGDDGAKNLQNHNDNRIIVSGNNFRDQNAMVQKVQETQNSRFHTNMGGLPAPSLGSP